MGFTVQHQKGCQFKANIREHEVHVDLPLSQGGSDTGPSPEEYLALSLASCVGMAAIAYCKRHEIYYDGVSINVSWDIEEGPARISGIVLQVETPYPLSVKDERAIMKAARLSLIDNTLGYAPEISVSVVVQPAMVTA